MQSQSQSETDEIGHTLVESANVEGGGSEVSEDSIRN